MTRAELVDHYLDKKLNANYDFSQIKKELKEQHEISGSELSEIVDLIANAELHHTKTSSKNNPGFVLFIITLGIIAIVYSIYGIVNSFSSQEEKMSLMSQSLNYMCLGGGIYVVIRNIKKLKN